MKKISPIWIPILFYLAAVELLVLVKQPELFLDKTLFLNRLVLFIVALMIYFIPKKISPKTRQLATILSVYALLTLFYKETAILNQLFYPIHDPVLQEWDFKIFGFQPALQFSVAMNHPVFSELMFFGYFSYYLLPLVVLGYLFSNNPDRLEEFGFLLIGSFLFYYFVFILFPAVGPQFFWDAPDNFIETKGIFGKIIKIIQENGEAPTAAFPSSHVGISLIILLWLKRNNMNLYLFLLPTSILLILATVYIKAHYAVDVLAGIVTAPLVYFVIRKCYFSFRKMMWS